MHRTLSMRCLRTPAFNVHRSSSNAFIRASSGVTSGAFSFSGFSPSNNRAAHSIQASHNHPRTNRSSLSSATRRNAAHQTTNRCIQTASPLNQFQYFSSVALIQQQSHHEHRDDHHRSHREQQKQQHFSSSASAAAAASAAFLAATGLTLCTLKRADCSMIEHFETPTESVAVLHLPVLHSDLSIWQRIAHFFVSLFNGSVFAVRVALRLPYIALLWSPLALTYLFIPFPQWLRLLVWTLQRSGAVFIKFGQWASTRPDLFSHETVAALTRLQSGVRPHSVRYTRKALRRALAQKHKLGQTRDDRLIVGQEELILSPELIGSGSMAQVHLGYIRPLNSVTSQQTTTSTQQQHDQEELVQQSLPPGSSAAVRHTADEAAASRGQLVAIKVLHPHTKRRMQVDLFIMHCGAMMLHYLPLAGLHYLSLPESVEQFSSFIVQHADLRIEAQNMTRFRQNFSQWKDVRFAKPYSEFCSSDVCVQSYEQGVPLDEFLKLSVNEKADEEHPLVKRHRASLHHLRLSHSSDASSTDNAASPPADVKLTHSDQDILRHNHALALCGMTMFLKMMIDDNLIHSDLHPGNLLVQLNPDYVRQHSLAQPGVNLNSLDVILQHPPSAQQLVVLDTGLVTELSPVNRANFLALFAALVQGDGRKCGELMRDNAREQHVENNDLYLAEMDDLVKQIPDVTLKKTTLGQLLQRVLHIVRSHRVKIESDFATLVVSMVILEGIGRKLDPDISIIKEAIPVLLKNKEARRILWQTCGTSAFNSFTIRAGLDALIH